MTWGASTMAAVAAAAITPPADAMNLRRSVVTLFSSRLDELMVGPFRDAVPRAHEGLELRERRVDLPRHGGLLRLLPDDVCGQLLEIAQHGARQLDDLDFALELR